MRRSASEGPEGRYALSSHSANETCLSANERRLVFQLMSNERAQLFVIICSWSRKSYMQEWRRQPQAPKMLLEETRAFSLRSLIL